MRTVISSLAVAFGLTLLTLLALPGCALVMLHTQPLNPPAVRELPQNGVLTVNSTMLSWSAPSSATGIAGYAYALDHSPTGQPPQEVMTADTSAQLQFPADGDWFFHVAALDRSGRWSSPATTELHVDTTPLNLGQLALSAAAFNPSTDSITLSGTISKPAQLTASIVSAASNSTVRAFTSVPVGGQIQVRWDGRGDRGDLLQPGDYRFQLHADDGAGRKQDVSSQLFTLTDKYIVVSLSRQTLTAYAGSSVLLRTPVTTGGPELPTPTGTFHILDKSSPLNVYSPWPKGSPYWFADTSYQYALEFFENSQYGLYIHDASWRTEYGPGSNVVDGTPGLDDTGTHGCINVPLDAQKELYPWALVGVPVIVQA